MQDLGDTIVAVSSAAGGVRSIVRITGPRTLPICEQVFAPSPEARISNLESQISNRTILPGSVCIREDLAADALLYPFLAPHSYTGEDLIELHVFGAACLVEALLERLLASGCRAAGPGEFTARAYLNGKLDLAQAEAVNEIVSSSNSLQLEAAERLLSGRLTKATAEIRSALLDILSLIEAGLDFSGEDIEFIGKEQAAQRLSDVQRQLEDLLAGSIRYETLMDLPAVGIAGAPNAGKSSLLNALLGWERSIVSPQPKTTRDVLTGVLSVCRSMGVPPVRGPQTRPFAFGIPSSMGVPPMDLVDIHRQDACDTHGRDGRATHGRDAHATETPHGVTTNDAGGQPFQCVLFDCAGLIPAPDNILDELAQRAAIEALQRCTAVLFCVDSAKADWSEDLAIRSLIQPKSLICVATKSDLAAEAGLPRRMQELTTAFGAEFLPVSATKRTGLEALVGAIESAVHRVPVRAYVSRASCPRFEGGMPATRITPDGVTTNAETGASVLALTARHRQAVTEAIENVRQAIAEVRQGREEVAVMMIRAACEAIAGIEQQHLDEQILDRIFNRFCIGK